MGTVHREHAAQAPADQAHLAAALAHQGTEAFGQAVLELGVLRAQPEVASHAPAVGVVAPVRDVPAQRRGRAVGAEEARQHHHRVPVAAARATQEGVCEQEPVDLEDEAPGLGQGVDEPWRCRGGRGECCHWNVTLLPGSKCSRAASGCKSRRTLAANRIRVRVV